MICRCATSRVAVVNRVKKTAKFLLLSSSISFMVHFPRCSLAFCDALYGSWRVHFLTLQGTNKYPLPRHFWRWGSFCHSFPQICASSPGGSIFVCFVHRFPRATATPLYGLGFSPCAITHRNRQCIGCPGSPVPFLAMGNATGFTRGDNLGGGFCFNFLILFTPILGEMIQFDSCLPNGLKPPTSNGWK